MNDDRALGTDGQRGNDGVAGHALIPGVIPGDWSSRLRGEAKGLRSTAERRERQGFEMTAEGRMLGALRNWYAGDGPAGKDVEELGRLASRLAEWSGGPLQPVHCLVPLLRARRLPGTPQGSRQLCHHAARLALRSGRSSLHPS